MEAEYEEGTTYMGDGGAWMGTIWKGVFGEMS